MTYPSLGLVVQCDFHLALWGPLFLRAFVALSGGVKAWLPEATLLDHEGAGGVGERGHAQVLTEHGRSLWDDPNLATSQLQRHERPKQTAQLSWS